jgi:hypothetical protein
MCQGGKCPATRPLVNMQEVPTQLPQLLLPRSCYPTTWYAAAAGVSAMPSIPGCRRSAVNFHTLSSTCREAAQGQGLINANGTSHGPKNIQAHTACGTGPWHYPGLLKHSLVQTT